MKGKALRRAIEVDAQRINADIPLITDTTELITPEVAQDMLRRNKHNRPINWRRVEEYSDTMARGEWALTSQGIILDSNENVLTGQKRLWAVIYSGANIYMRVSRGNAPETARLLDRGTPQSSRDLASRETGKKHSPVDASLARAFCALMGNTKPSTDVLATTMAVNADSTAVLLAETNRIKKTKSVLMILAASMAEESDVDKLRSVAARVEMLARRLDEALSPQLSSKCWGRGAAFGLAMDRAQAIVRNDWNQR